MGGAELKARWVLLRSGSGLGGSDASQAKGLPSHEASRRSRLVSRQRKRRATAVCGWGLCARVLAKKAWLLQMRQ